jgi:hypothetical protein
MSIKSFKSKRVKIVALATVVSMSLGGLTYTGPYKALKAKQQVKAEENIIQLKPMSFKFVDDIAVTTTTTTNTTTTATTCTTTTTETPTTSSNELSTTGVVTSTTTSETTQPVTEASTEEVIETPVEVCAEPKEAPHVEEAKVEETTEAESKPDNEESKEVIGFKPSTHYIHRASCHWYNEECVPITSTEGIEARICTECNPDIEIMNPYTEPAPATTDTAIAVTDYEYIILCNLVAGEYGSDCVSVYDKGAVVATVIHRLWEGTRWTGGASASIYNVIAAPYQYDGKYLAGYYSPNVTQSCKDAVTYALNNIHDYDYYTNPDGTSIYMINSFYGDGRYNWFRCS